MTTPRKRKVESAGEDKQPSDQGTHRNAGDQRRTDRKNPGTDHDNAQRNRPRSWSARELSWRFAHTPHVCSVFVFVEEA